MFTAGPPGVRALALLRALDAMDADAVMAVRGGYGSVDLLPLLDVDRIRRARTAFIGYSDVTSLHSFLNGIVGLASVHGAMIDGRLAKGPAAYDPATLLRSLSAEPLGELAPDGLEVVQPGTAAGALVGGTLTQLLASFETPYAFRPPAPHVLFIDEVGERPYRLHRMLTQLGSSGRMASAAALVFGELPRCDEPGGSVTVRDVVRDAVRRLPWSGAVRLSLGPHHDADVERAAGCGRRRSSPIRRAPRLVIDEAAAAP